MREWDDADEYAMKWSLRHRFEANGKISEKEREDLTDIFLATNGKNGLANDGRKIRRKY